MPQAWRLRWCSWLLLLLVMACKTTGAQMRSDWDDWLAFDEAFIDAQGRVIDWTDGGRTISEAQGYALFFALVANDRKRFAQILQWTRNNLAGGDLTRNLPAWLWGRRPDGSWGVIDANSATDADLWIAYALLEAGRLWQEPDYQQTGHAMLGLIKAASVMQVPAGPLLLLPAPQGFIDAGGRIRINPSYYMPAQLLALHAADPDGPWQRLLADYVALLPQIAPLGRAPDWAAWATDRIVTDGGGVGGYDAIRVYLWAGMVTPDPDSALLRSHLRGYAAMLAELRHTPERWTVGNSGITGSAPPGFDAALLPYLLTLGERPRYQALRETLDAAKVGKLYGQPARYYDQVLVLFGKAYADGRYRFDATGRVVPSWQ